MTTRTHTGLILRAAGVAIGLAAVAGCARDATPSRPVPGGDPHRGERQILAYGCGSCHDIPGIDGASGMVGPPLEHFARRTFIAGELPNTSDYLVRWIVMPQSIEPGTAMPNLGVSDGEARDIAAYLYTLR